MISDIRLTPIHTPRRNGEVSQHALVEVDSDDGTTGYGEMSDLTDPPITMPDLDDLQLVLKEILIGIPESQLSRLGFLLDGLFAGRNDPGLYTGNMRCGLDTALHDLLARRRGISVTEMLGGPTRETIKCCYPLFRVMSDNDIDASLATVDNLVGSGFHTFRVYVGGDPEADVAHIERLYEEFGKRIYLQAFDCSNKLDPVAAAKLLKRLCAVWEPAYVESVAAADDYRGMRYVRSATNMRISEHVGSIKELLAISNGGGCDVVNVMPTAIGGIRHAIHMFQLCQDLGIQTILSTTQSTSIGTAAELAIGAAVTNVDYPTVSIGPMLYVDDICDPGIQYVGDVATVPSGPGLGVVPDAAKIRALTKSLSWRNYEFDNQVPDHSASEWKTTEAASIHSARLKKH